VEFVYIDPSWSAERIAAKRKYAGHMYYQYEPEESWTRPGVRAFGRVNGGAIFEACYLLDKGSVPLLSVFYSDKAHLKGWGHHPIYREWGTNLFFFVSLFVFSIICILHIMHIMHI
jgi:hypothetical protein